MFQLPDYRIARQRHVGDMLDQLQSMGLLTWKWRYDTANSRAIYRVALGNDPVRELRTREAEELVQDVCDEHGIIWEPVPHPGGEDKLREVEARIAWRRHQAEGRAQ